QRLAFPAYEVLRTQALVSVLTAADVVDVVGVRVERLADPVRNELEAQAAPRAATLEHEQVAAVGVDVHEVRVEHAHAQRAAPARSARVPVRRAPESAG